jgi:hypothetical protein
MARVGRVASHAPLRWGECRHSGRCIVTGCDVRHEWMLPWWHENVRRHSGLPVVFVDFGLSPRALAWCRARGEVVRGVAPAASALLAKPIGIIQSPYAESLWTDLDCEILKPVEPIFGEARLEIGVVRDVPGAFDPIQAGVVVVRHGSMTALEWAGLCRDWKKLDRSRIPTCHQDQSLLAHLWRLRPDAFTLLGDEWNRGRRLPDARRPAGGEDAAGEAAIVHWWGRDGKAVIRRRVAARPSGDPCRALEPGPFSLVRRAWVEVGRIFSDSGRKPGSLS